MERADWLRLVKLRIQQDSGLSDSSVSSAVSARCLWCGEIYHRSTPLISWDCLAGKIPHPQYLTDIKLYLTILVYRYLNQVIYCLNALLSYLLVTAIITLSVYVDIKISSFYH